MTRPALAFDPPAGSTPRAATAPVAVAVGAEVRDFAAGEVEGASWVVGCVATPIPGWVEDMRAPVEARAHTFSAKLAERVVGEPVLLRDRPGDDLKEIAFVARDAPPLGFARAWVGFDRDADPRVLTCGAACLLRDGASGDCEAALRRAHLTGDGPPPPPGAALGALAWGVHHPRETVVAGGALAGLALLLAVVTRRRPRFRGGAPRGA